MKKSWLVISSLSLFFFCKISVGPLQAQELTRVRLGYAGLSVVFLNVLIAQDAGIFEKNRLAVELIQMAGPIPIAALVAGEIDYQLGFATSLAAAAQGLPLKGIMVTLQTPPFYIISEPSIQKLEDLTGKKGVAVDRIGSLQHLVARLLLKSKGVNPERVTFTQTGSVSNTMTSLSQGAVSAALLSGPHNVIMVQKGFRQIGAAEELPMRVPTSGLVVHEAKLKNDPGQIKLVIRAMLESIAFSRREKSWVIGYIKNKWKLDSKVAEEVYGQWLATLAMDGKISLKDLQEYFDLAHAYRQIAVPVQVKALTDYTLLDQVLKERAGR